MKKTRIRVREMKMVDASLLEPHPGNFRVHTPEQRTAMDGVLNEVGFAGAVLVRELDGGRYQILDGHLRVEEMAGQKVPILVTDLSETEARKVLATFDAVGSMADVDVDGLRALIEGIEWDNKEIEKIIAEALGESPAEEAASAMGEDDEAPISRAAELREKWKTERGQLWELGEHRLLCGNSTNEKDYLRLMDGDLAALLVTDPPYGVSYASKNEFLNAISPGNRIQVPIVGDHEKPEDMAIFWVAAFTAARAVCKPGASYYVTGPQVGDLLLLLLQSLRQSDFPLRHMLIWAKNNHVLGRCDYNYKHEPIIFGWVEGTHRFYGDHSETSLWEIDKPHKSEFHPTQKPIELFARCMRNSSELGDTVLDPFSGSGTTILGAEQLGRRARAIEIDPGYVAVALERWAGVTGKTPSLVSNDTTGTIEGENA